MTVLLHPATRAQLRQLAKKPSGSYIFSGPAGIGRFTAALEWGSAVTKESPQRYITSLEPVKGSIGVAEIHAIVQELQLKADQTRQQRVVIIRDADTMTVVAQNALLKTLEEPPEYTTIILVATQPANLLPTIVSRCQTVTFPLLAPTVIQCYLEERGIAPDTAAQLVVLSDGLPGKAVALSHDPEMLVRKTALQEQVENFAHASLYRRFLLSQELSQSTSLTEFLAQLGRWLQGQVRQTTVAEELDRLSRHLQAVEATGQYLRANGNKKFACDKLAMELSAC